RQGDHASAWRHGARGVSGAGRGAFRVALSGRLSTGCNGGGLRLMTAHAELVAVRIAKVSAVVVRVILRTQTRRPLARAAVSERRGVRAIDRGAVGGEQGDHLTVAGRRWLAVVRLADHEQ